MNKGATIESYTVRVLGQSCWMDGISTLEEARAERDAADRVAQPGHVIIAEMSNGETRVVKE